LKFEIFLPEQELIGFDGLAFLTHVMSTSRRTPQVERKDFDSCKGKSQLMLIALNEPVEITG